MSDKITLGLTQEQAHQLLMVLQELHSYHNALADVYEALKVKMEKGPRQDRAKAAAPVEEEDGAGSPWPAVVVTKLDRPARSSRDLHNILHHLLKFRGSVERDKRQPRSSWQSALDSAASDEHSYGRLSARRSASMSDRVNSTSPPRAFIESDRVEGTALHDLAGKPLGTIKRLIIEKTSGRVAYAVISIGGTDEVPHTVPWAKLQYDVALGAYRTDITERQLQEAPAFARQEEHDWSDLDRSAELDAYYSVPPHLRVI